jgi:hypothetical protein
MLMPSKSAAAALLLAAALPLPLFAQQTPSDKLPNPTPLQTAPPTPNTGDKLQQLGSQSADEQTTADVRTALAAIINTALTENKFQDLTARLAHPDRTRLADNPQDKPDDLNKAIARFRQDFRAKYNQDFELKPDQLKDAAITMGLDKNSVSVNLSDLEKNPAVNPAPASAIPSPAKPLGDTAKNIPADTGQSVVPGPTVALVREGRSASGLSDAALWKVNIPNEISPRQIQQNLVRHLSKLNDQKTTWSTDANATSRAAAAQVIQALTDAALASDQ